MARPLRIEFEGALYHVTARGNDRRDIFRDEKDFKKFIAILKEYAERFGVRTHCYVLMKNHYHLLVETPNANLADFMHNVQSHYTNYFNRRHGRVGHLFQGRYKSLIVDKESYLLELSGYIHLNPVRAGLVKHPRQWRWSSYREYIAKTPSGEGWIKKDETLKHFGKYKKTAVKKYMSYVLREESAERSDPFADVTAQLILGSEEFVVKVKKMIKGGKKKLGREIAGGRELSRWTSREADKAISRTAATFSVKKRDILERGGYRNRPRQAAILLFHRYSRWTVTEIGETFGISGAAVSKTAARFENEMKKDRRLSQNMKYICSIFSA